MPFGRRHHNKHHHHATHTNTTTARPARRSIFSRRRPVQHHKRKPTMKDKISGALLKLRGSLTHRPGVKAAGTRRMHGTDGRRAHHAY